MASIRKFSLVKIPPRLDEWSPSLLKSRLYGQLLVDIIIGALAPGERLDEQALARRYGGGPGRHPRGPGAPGAGRPGAAPGPGRHHRWRRWIWWKRAKPSRPAA